MDHVDELRRMAAECLATALSTSDLSARGSLLMMAQKLVDLDRASLFRPGFGAYSTLRAGGRTTERLVSGRIGRTTDSGMTRDGSRRRAQKDGGGVPGNRAQHVRSVRSREPADDGAEAGRS